MVWLEHGRKFGIRTPADRITGARKAVWKIPEFLPLLTTSDVNTALWNGFAIPGTTDAEDEIDEKIYNVIPDALRWSFGGFSVLDSSVYDGNWYLGSFGSSFNDQGWNGAYEWLAIKMHKWTIHKTSICIVVGLWFSSNEYRGTPICF